MTPDGRSITLDSQKRLRTFNWADYRLYDYFQRKLDREGGRQRFFLLRNKEFSVRKIGEEKVNAIVERITHAAQVITEECLKPDMSTGWITSPILKPEKARNQTCYFMTKGISWRIALDYY